MSAAEGYDPTEEEQDDAIDVEAFLGVDRARTRVTQYLKELVDNPDQQQGLEVQLWLMKTKDVRQEKSVASIPHDLDQKISETVETILRLAIEDMETASYAPRQGYCVRVEGIVRRLNFVLERIVKRGSPSEGSQVFPDQQGAFQLALDQTKSFGDKIIQLADTVVNQAGRHEATMLAIVNRQDQQLARHEKMEFDRVVQMRKLVAAEDERKMVLEDFSREQERKDKFADGFKQLAAPVAAAVLGPQAGAAVAMVSAMTQPQVSVAVAAQDEGGTTVEESNLVDALVASLERNPQKLQKILAGLDTSDVAIFAELHKRSASRQESRRGAPTNAAEENKSK